MSSPIVALSLPTLSLSDDEQRVLNNLKVQLERFRPENKMKADYYDAKAAMADLRISIPPTLAGMEVAVGWPAAAVDCVEERLDFEAWLPGISSDDDDPFGLDEVYLSNDLDTESQKVHLDGLIHGVGFAAVTTGLEGEPDPLITIESPLNATAMWDPRTRRATAGYLQRLDVDGRVASACLLLPDQTIWLGCNCGSDGSIIPGSWRILERDQHKLGRVAMAQFVNRPRSATGQGHSEITETVRRLTQSGLRTIAAAEVAREYFAAPQRYVLGAKESFFTDGDGNPIPAWKSYMGRMLALERDEYGDLPDIKEFRGAGLETFFAMLKSLAQLLSGEAGIPQNYLGFSTDNPPSAEAINAMEARLVKRAERRQRYFGRGWTEVARLAIMVRDGRADLSKDELAIRPKWRPAHTPTLAAAADATQKLVAAGVLPAQSRITWDRLDIPRADQQVLDADIRRARVTDLINGFGQGPAAPAKASQKAPGGPENAVQTGS
jgi:hypothetical protein